MPKLYYVGLLKVSVFIFCQKNCLPKIGRRIIPTGLIHVMRLAVSVHEWPVAGGGGGGGGYSHDGGSE